MPKHTQNERSSFEVRLHGRGGQGGVTCAKILASLYAHLGRSVQAFGDYAGERSGAPLRAYLRVAAAPITNRNKVYAPDHLVVLDASLLDDETVSGLVPGGTLLVNTPAQPGQLPPNLRRYRLATIDATSIARRHGIGTRSVVIVNTTVAGAFLRVLDLSVDVLEETYKHLGLLSNLAAAREAYEAVRWEEAQTAHTPNPVTSIRASVCPIVEHVEGPPTGLRTGSWRTQTPHYVTRLAPCSASCPAGNDVIGFVRALAEDDFDRAVAVLSQTTAFPGICGRVCPAPCMRGCNRRDVDGAVNIRALERYVGDHMPFEQAVKPAHGSVRAAVVGGGPAGLTAARSLALAGHRVTIFDTEPALGGVLRVGIPKYRLPRQVLDREVDRILRLGVETSLGKSLERRAVSDLLRSFDAVLLATGLAELRGLEGAALAGIEQGNHFLRRLNMEGLEIEGHVMVLGGGNTAMDCARGALRAGAARVTVAYRRSRAEMPAIPEEVDEAVHEGVEFLFLRQPVAFHGRNRVEAVELAEVDLGPPDESGRRSPQVSDRRVSISCDAVLLALGQSADLGLLPQGTELRNGWAFQGNRPLKLFAAGDFATGDGTVAHAIGDGRRAAGRLLRALGVDGEVFEPRDRAQAVPPTDIRTHHFERVLPVHAHLLEPSVRVRGFDEVHAGLSDASEARRCFSCGFCTRCDTCLVYCPEGIVRRKNGSYEIDYTYCKGCGVCVAECPRAAMEMRL